jgi:hypothetical protein
MAHHNATARDLESDIVGTKPARPAAVLDFGPLFSTAASPPLEPPRPRSWTEHYAALAANSRDGAKLNELGAAVMNRLLDAFGSAAVWEVRLALGAQKKIANNGKETLDGLGGLGTGMGLQAVDRERPPAWAREELEKSHGNVNTVWVRPSRVAQYDAAARRRRLAQETPDSKEN